MADSNSFHSIVQDEACWQTVLAREAARDGFVYAVRSTGIYCRPSCPSRRPRRRNVVFFPAPEAAEQAGFRPCRRCRPQLSGNANPQIELVRRICASLDASPDTPLTLSALSEKVQSSPYHLQRVFKRYMGITPREYADALRLNRLKTDLRNGRDVTSAMYEAGYGSSSRLYEQAPGQLGMTPATYGRGGEGANISYTIAGCSLGRILVAATDRGLCAVSLGGSDEPLERALAAEYPKAKITRNDLHLRPWLTALLHQMAGERPNLNLPLDVQATAFERRVWQELRNIPYGATRTYAQIARTVGRPKAARAVANACAKNPVAVAIPCHRVVRGDGSAGGYRWGAERKDELLAREQDQCRR